MTKTLLLTSILTTSFTKAALYRVNLHETDPATPDETVGNANWDDIQVATTGSGITINDKAGSNNATIGWATGFANPNNDQASTLGGDLGIVFNSYLHLGSTGETLTIAGLTAGEAFTLSVYSDVNQAAVDIQNRTGTVSVLGAVSSLSLENIDGGTASLVVNNGTNNHLSNQLDFSGTVDASGTMTITYTSGTRLALNGFILETTPVPEPSSALLLSLAGFSLILRRRK